jgi:hypothetical protein
LLVYEAKGRSTGNRSKPLTDDPGVQTHLFHVAFPFFAAKNFNSNPQSKNFRSINEQYLCRSSRGVESLDECLSGNKQRGE